MFSFLNAPSNLNTPNLRGYQTNNKYTGFPPLMNDSRSLIACWQPEATINNNIIKEQKIKSNWQYRKYLQDNASEIMKYNMEEACNDNGYYISHGESKSTPAFYNSLQEPTKDSSDLKNMYLSKEQLAARKISPSITQSQLIESWGSLMNPHTQKP